MAFDHPGCSRVFTACVSGDILLKIFRPLSKANLSVQSERKGESTVLGYLNHMTPSSVSDDRSAYRYLYKTTQAYSSFPPSPYLQLIRQVTTSLKMASSIPTNMDLATVLMAGVSYDSHRRMPGAEPL